MIVAVCWEVRLHLLFQRFKPLLLIKQLLPHAGQVSLQLAHLDNTETNGNEILISKHTAAKHNCDRLNSCRTIPPVNQIPKV